MKLIISFFLLLFSLHAAAQEFTVYPTNWWVGMKNPTLQLMIHKKNIGSVKNIKVNSKYVSLKKISRVENKNWLFLDLIISASSKSGAFDILLDKEKITYVLKERRKKENGRSRIRGITSADLVYLIMPDRFANGDTANDRITSMRELENSRDSLKGRHGGDLQGIVDHLDYIQEMGATALWLNPVLESDRPRESFHGYAFTDHYKIDPRFGGDAAYHNLIEKAHSKGLKIIQDAVYNHVDVHHVTVTDLPMKDWLNQWSSYHNTTYKDQVLMDPYGSAFDRHLMSEGWFTPLMPDLNQKNKFVAEFLIQHAVWTTENFGIDGWRIDTYAYCDLAFMNRCNKRLLDEYPQIGIFAETWVHGMTNQSFFVKNNYTKIFNSNLPGVTDFQLYYAMNDALNNKYGWTEGISKLNLTLAADFVYEDAYRNSIFLDNHDLTRFYTVMGERLDKFKMGINWLLTLRGIPQLYYGTEILMTGSTYPTDALVRKDFPGGWHADPVNKFNSKGRTVDENEAFNYIKKLANFRRTSTALQTGKLMQFVPFNGLYIYFRYNDTQTIMVVSNTDDKPYVLDMKIYQERMNGYHTLRDIITDKEISLQQDVIIPAYGSAVYLLSK